MDKIKASELAAYRLALWEKQDKRCAITGQPLAFSDAVLDHCHRTGQVRGVLDRGVNSMLGKIENHMKLARLTNMVDLHRMLIAVPMYLGRVDKYPPHLYPTHKTADEKRVARNAKARKARAKKAAS